MVKMNPKLLHITKHQLDKMAGATLSDGLRQQYGHRNARVVKGDSVRVMRGEYKGVEGKVERVNVKSGTLVIEGIQHDKVRGGQVKVPIHASNVMITSLKTDDKLRFSGTTPKEQPTQEQKAEASEPRKTKTKAKPKKAAKKTKKKANKAAKKKGVSK